VRSGESRKQFTLHQTGATPVCVYSVVRDLGSMDDGRRVSALVCQDVERGGQAIGSCQERR